MRVVRHWNRLPTELWIPLPGNVQGWVEWGIEQPALGEGVPACCSRLELDDL